MTDKERFEKHLLRNIETLRAMIGAYGTQDMADLAGDINQKMLEVTRQNKRYREAVEKIEELYNEIYSRTARGCANEYLDGLETALHIIQRELKGE